MTSIEDVPVEFKIKEELYGVVPEPYPSARDVPEWYSQLPIHPEDEYGPDITAVTAKACMPFLEATTRGWLLPLPADVFFRVKDGEIEVTQEDLDSKEVVIPQSPNLYGNHPQVGDEHHPLELQTPWRADVPDEYMVWVLPPLNRRQYDIYEHFEPYSGIYNAGNTFRPLGIVGLLNTSDVHNLRIRAGTPIAQLVFMHRDSFLQDATAVPMSDADVLREKRYENSRKVKPSRYREELWKGLGGTRTLPTITGGDGSSSTSKRGE